MAGISKKKIKTKTGEKVKYTITYTDIFGKRHTSGYYDTKKEAETHKKEFETPKANHDITYGFIFQQYLTRVENTLAKNTYLNYNRYYNSCLKPFDKIKYDKINSLMWQNFFDELIKKQTAYTVQGCLRFAKASVNYFIKHGEIEFNIFNKIEKIKVPKPDINHLTIEELKDVLECCKKCYREYYPLLFTFIGTGAREGEILALEKTDFSFKEGCITISKQFTKNELKLTPKTESSNRKIYLFDELKEVLNEHIKGLPPDYKLLFPNKNGGYISQSNFNKRVFQPILKLCGITKRIRIHDLRGSYIDMVLSSGLSVKFAQNQAGHADSKTTLNIYARNNGDMITAATNTLDSIFRKNQQKISNKVIQFPKKQSRLGDLNPRPTHYE